MEILVEAAIELNQLSISKEAAITSVGQRLVDLGYVTPAYIKGMYAREAKVTTYIGNGVAIPHGEGESKDAILHSGISIYQYPEGIDFGDGNMAYLVIGIAGVGDAHMAILSSIAIALMDEAVVEQLAHTTSKQMMLDILTKEVTS